MILKSFVKTLPQTLNWHKERCETFSSLVIGLIDQGNVQHHALTPGLAGTPGLFKSKLERIRRFFAYQEIDYKAFAWATVMSVFKKIPKMHLILDRTSWKFGKKDINYLVLTGTVGSVTVPLFWSLLDHQGCSNAAQRVHLLDQFKETFGLDCILSFTADREFVGKEWLSYLHSHDIPFFIRLKDNRVIDWGQNQKRPLKDFFAHLEEGEERALYTMINTLDLLVVGKRVKGEFVVICSNVKNPKKVLKTYSLRWKIERCFLQMKTNGFNLENTHMTLIDRLMKLMCVVTVAIFMASLCGLTLKSPFKKTVGSPLYSYFTRGLRALKFILLKPGGPQFLVPYDLSILSEG
jgi:hypothetical protein